MDDYGGYQDDFSEGEGLNNDYYNEEEGERDSPAVEAANDRDDEQFTQKVTGKLEQLQRRVEELEQELSNERQLVQELKQQNLEALQNQQRLSNAESVDQEAIKAELQKYKSKCSHLQEKYEMSLLTGSSPSSLPGILEREIQQYCEKHKIFPDLINKSISAAEAVNVLKSLFPKRTRNDTDSALQDKIRGLEEELKGTAAATLDDAQQLKNKIFHLSERIRVEKEYKRNAENEVGSCKKRIAMLGDHMEKMIIHLKRESAHKLRLAEQLRSTEKENVRYKEKCDQLAKKIATKDRLLYELREGSKVLEDQLRLMDEKYLELRGKLDWARSVATRKIKKAEKTAADLRVKFAMTGSPLLLDNISLPDGGSEQDFPTGSSWAPGGAGLVSQPSGILRGATPLNRCPPGRLRSSGDSVRSLGTGVGSQRSELSLDNVLEKIRMQQGAKQDWNEEKLKKLVQSR